MIAYLKRAAVAERHLYSDLRLSFLDGGRLIASGLHLPLHTKGPETGELSILEAIHNLVGIISAFIPTTDQQKRQKEDYI